MNRRAFVAVPIALYVLLTPAIQQVFHVANPTRSWTMFSGVGYDVCEVAFFDGDPASGAPIDRYAALGTTWSDAPPTVLRIGDEKAARAVGKKLCRALPGSSVHAKLRCPVHSGWKVVLDGSEDLCTR